MGRRTVPTATQRKNLLKLAAYLESLPADYSHFGMRFYADHRGDCDLPMEEDLYAAKDPQGFLTNCGTVACAVGHGPAAGIRPKTSEFYMDGRKAFDFDWNVYVERAFGIGPTTEEFAFLFSDKWVGLDDHHYGAAARIRYYLDTGEVREPSYGAVEVYEPYRKAVPAEQVTA